MAFFPCSRCGCVEDTALCHFWSARLRQMPTMCSACDPTIGKWHGQFPQESARDWTTDERGFLLWSRRELECWLGQPIEIIGKVSPSGPHSLPAEPYRRRDTRAVMIEGPSREAIELVETN
jgi:hypothetical protein